MRNHKAILMPELNAHHWVEHEKLRCRPCDKAVGAEDRSSKPISPRMRHKYLLAMLLLGSVR